MLSNESKDKIENMLYQYDVITWIRILGLNWQGGTIHQIRQELINRIDNQVK